MTTAKFRKLLFACILLPQALSANPHVDAIVDALKTQGYSRIEISRTMLGRHRIVATSPDAGREIVVYGGTGTILRDSSFEIDDDDSASNDNDTDGAKEDPNLSEPNEENDAWFDGPLEGLFDDPNPDDAHDDNTFEDTTGWQNTEDTHDDSDDDDDGSDGVDEW